MTDEREGGQIIDVVKGYLSVLIILGAIGMLISFLFMWSLHFVDVMGAGMAFIAGSILMVSGLVSLAVITREYAGKSLDNGQPHHQRHPAFNHGPSRDKWL